MAVRLSIALSVVAVLAACSRSAPPPDPVRAVRTLTVSAQSAAATFEYAGEIRPRVESKLGFRVGGKVVQRLVDVGDAVKAGQVLAQLDPQDLRLGQQAAVAATAAAQAAYDQMASDYQRYKDLRDQGFISSADLERREMSLKTARAQLDQAKAQSNVQRNQATYAVLIADASGIVTGVDAEPGMVVAAGAPVLRLAHDGPRDVVFSVPEDKVETVRAVAAQPGRLKVRLWGDGSAQVRDAGLREVSAAADPMTRTFMVKADLGETPPGGAWRLGQTATVMLDLPQVPGVTKLPLSALREEQGRTVVWLVDRASMTVTAQPVQIAGADGNEAVVSSGLVPGQIVVTAGVHVLAPGQKVKFYVEPAKGPLGAPATPVAMPVVSR
jgi:membrane fusion protein, multidrug efflux system